MSQIEDIKVTPKYLQNEDGTFQTDAYGNFVLNPERVHTRVNKGYVKHPYSQLMHEVEIAEIVRRIRKLDAITTGKHYVPKSNNRTQRNGSRANPAQYIPNERIIQGTDSKSGRTVRVKVKDNTFRKVLHSRVY